MRPLALTCGPSRGRAKTCVRALCACIAALRCIALESLSLAQLNTWGTGQAPLASLAPLTALRRVDLSHLPDGAQLTALSRVTHLTLRHSNIKPESLKHMTSLHTLVGVRLWLLGQADHDTETDQTKDTNPIILPGERTANILCRAIRHFATAWAYWRFLGAFLVPLDRQPTIYRRACTVVRMAAKVQARR